MLKAKLVVVGGESKHTEVDLRLPLIIGRGREVNLTVPHALVSRRHAEIFERDGRLVVRDLGSLNGTFINNQRIESEQALEPEQLLTLGNVTFRAIYQIDDGSTPTDIDVLVEPVSVSEQATDVDFDAETNAVILTNSVPCDDDQPTVPISSFSNETVDVDSIRSDGSELVPVSEGGGSADESASEPTNSTADQFQVSASNLGAGDLFGSNQIAEMPQLKTGESEISSKGSAVDFDFVGDRRSEDLEGSDSSIMGSFLKNRPR